MKRVVVTGSTGFLGGNLVNALIKNAQYEIIAVVGDSYTKDTIGFDTTKVKVLRNRELLKGNLSNIDTVINCAFARSGELGKLASALDYTAELIQALEKSEADFVINISSQGVYKRLPKGELSREDSPIAPIDVYSICKYATEKMFNVSAIKNVTNIRLASLNMKQRFLYKFILKAVNGEKIVLTTPEQSAALLDVNDASAGLVRLVESPCHGRRSVYNLGIGTQMTIYDYALCVKSYMKRHGYYVDIEVRDGGDEINSGMDCTRFFQDYSWTPSVTVENMIEKYVSDFYA